MNELNYASLEASKKLVEAGIVLETDFQWIESSERWIILETNTFYGESIPAPSMVEMWRELPNYSYIEKFGQKTLVWVCDDEREPELLSDFIMNTNPTDALAELLIWVRKEEKKGV